MATSNLGDGDEVAVHVGPERETKEVARGVTENLTAGRTAIHYAAHQGFADVVEQLLRVVPRELVFLADANGQTALHDAAINGHDQVVAQLLAFNPELANIADSHGLTPLQCASRAGHFKVIALLGGRVTNSQSPAEEVLATSPADSVALHQAALSGDHQAVARLLAENPELIGAVTGQGLTLLHIAVKSGHYKVFAQVLEAVANNGHQHSEKILNAADEHGRTALHLAAGLGQAKMVEQLLATNPMLIHTRDSIAHTALTAAVIKGHEEVVEQLLAAGVPHVTLAVDRDGRSLLELAVIHDQPLVVEQLLTKTISKLPALHLALRLAREAIVDILLEADGELVHPVDRFGANALHAAANNCSEPFVAKWFQQSPVEALQACNCFGDTPWRVFFRSFKGERENYSFPKDVVEVLQRTLTFDEMVTGFSSTTSSDRLLADWRPAVEKLCELLFVVLNQDVVSTVFEYLGFRCLRRTANLLD